MIAAAELVAAFKIPLEEQGGYIWGASGQVWTAAKQNAATRAQTISYGKRWIGRRVWDCSGMFVWAYKRFGESIYHGSNTIWHKYCSTQGKLTAGHRSDGYQLRPGTAVFLLNDTGRHHIGLYIGDDICIEAKGTKYGVVTSPISHWDEWGELKAVDYGGENTMADTITAYPTLKKGDKGEDVKALQTKLAALGYTIEVDGIFGAKTDGAVKFFQMCTKLTEDGVVGPKTWAKLNAAVEAAAQAESSPDDAKTSADDAKTSADDADEATVAVDYTRLMEIYKSVCDIKTALEPWIFCTVS